MGVNLSFKSSWHYIFQRKLGRGGSSEVFLYRRFAPGLPPQDVVLKVLSYETETAIEGLLNEGQRLSELKHPNIVSSLGYEKLNDKTYALVLEYINGGNLKEIILQTRKVEREAITAYVLKGIAKGLLAAHNQNVIHGDISSRNILVSAEGSVKLSDFGESRLSNSGNKGTLKASLDYLSPEQWEGAPTSLSSDTFALGVLAFEMLSGQNPLSPAHKKGGKEKVLSFLKSFDPAKYKNWESFLLGTLQLDPRKRVSLKSLINLMPEDLEGQKTLVTALKRVNRDCPTPCITSSFQIPTAWSEVYVEWALRAISVPLLKPFLSLILLVNSVAIGTDYCLEASRFKPSSLTVTSYPWGEVWIDGQSKGYTPILNLMMRPGFHQFIWRDAKGAEARKTIMDYGNGTFAYQIIHSGNSTLKVAPLMGLRAQERP